MNKNSLPALMNAAHRFKELRKEMLGSRATAADFLGVSEDCIKKWENAERPVAKHAWNQLGRLNHARGKCGRR